MPDNSPTAERIPTDALLNLWSTGEASASDLTEMALRSIDARNADVNAVLTVMADEARADANRVDSAAARGEPLALRGMPITLKDNIDTAGVRTTMASDFFRDNVPATDASVVKQLRNAGAVIVGKANLHEFVLGATGQSHHLGPCRNPWDREHIPGGSSSGSGASIATGMCIGSIGSDTGGSIRGPAAFTNVCGLRPTHGRVSSFGAFPVSPTHDTLGPLASRASDVALILDAISGYDPRDATTEARDFAPVAPSLRDTLQGVTLGVPRAFYCENLDAGVEQAFEESLLVLRERGARIIDVEMTDAERAWHLCSRVLVMADAAALHRERMETQSQRMGQDVYARVSVGRNVSGMQYADALRVREEWRVQVRAVFGQCDALLMPTCPFPAPRIDEAGDMGGISNEINRFNFTWAFAGVPALSIPCGLSAGLPVAFQAVAPWWRDDVALSVGTAFQAATTWHERTAPST